VIQGAHFPILDFWRSTRFIGPEEVGPIHEFPYFTFLYGDLHAHQIALPLTLAVLLVGLNVVRSLRRDNSRRVPWPSLVIAGVLVAMLRATNTWDYPTYAAIVALCLVLGSLPGLLRLDRRTIQALVIGLVVFGIVFQFSFAPYLQRFQLFYNGVDPVKARTALSQYLTIHGLFLFVGGSLFAWYAVQARRRVVAVRRHSRLVPEPGYYGMILPIAGLSGYASPAGWAVGVGAVLGLVLLLAGYVTRGFLVFGIGVAVAACIAHWRRSNRTLQAALFAVALFATLIPEFVSLQGDVGRMNTVFKFYLQAWVLLSITAAVALGWLVRKAARERLLRQVRPAWVAVAAVLVLAAVAYPLLASKGKVALRFSDMPLSLDGMQYMDVAQYLDDGKNLDLPADAKAIRWLQDNVAGTPVVLEGRSPVYRWGSRISIYTGLPTVLGWDVHQGQQRAGYSSMIQERITDVERAYGTVNSVETLGILRKYQVRYVVIGGLERAYYPLIGLDKFRTMPELGLVYDADGVQIYEVHS
jgi:YYY domain-containing protein